MRKRMNEPVIPANAGIQSVAAPGSRVKPGMTTNGASIDSNLIMY